MKNRKQSSERLFSFARRALTVLVGFAVVVMLMGAGCNGKYTQEEYNKAIFEAKKQAKAEGLRIGRAQGTQTGRAEGHERGYDAGYAQGLVDGQDRGETKGYIKGSVWFAKNSWIPSLGTALVVLMTIILFRLLSIIFKKYRERIISLFALKAKRDQLIYDVAKLESRREGGKTNLLQMSLDTLEEYRTHLESVEVDRVKTEIKKLDAEGRSEVFESWLQCQADLENAKELIDRVKFKIGKDNMTRREQKILNFLKQVSSDSSLSKSSLNSMLSELNS